MANFKKGMKVAKIISGYGTNTGTIQEVEKVKKGKVHLIDSGLEYDDSTGEEIDPAIPGFRSYIVYMEDLND